MRRSWIVWCVLLVAACASEATQTEAVQLAGSVQVAAGADLRGLVITALGPSPQSTVTASDGSYVLSGLRPGAYQICVVVPASQEGEVCVEAIAKAATSTAPELVATPLGEVRGRFVDVDGQPIAGVAVGASGEVPVAISDAQGGFVLRGLRAGARRLFASRSGYVPLLQRAVDVEWQAESILPAVTLQRETQPLSAIVGTIEQIGVPSATPPVVTFAPIGLTATCDSKGRFEQVLPTGVYSVVVTAERRRFAIPRLLVGDGHAYLVDGDFRELQTLRVPIGENLPPDYLSAVVSPTGRHVAQRFRSTKDPLTRLEVVDLTDDSVVYEDEISGTAAYSRDGRSLYAARANFASGQLDLAQIDLATQVTVGLLPDFVGNRFVLPSATGETVLAFDGQGSLRRLSDGKALLSHSVQSPSAASVAPLDERTFTLAEMGLQRCRLEVRDLSTGQLEREVAASGCGAKLRRLDGRLFVVDDGLYEVAPSGEQTKLCAGRAWEPVVGDQFLLEEPVGWQVRYHLYRPADGRTVTFDEVRVVPPMIFVRVAPDIVSMRTLEDPEIELASLPASKLDFVSPSQRYYFAAAGVSDLGASWTAVEVTTGTQTPLGFGARPVESNGRFFLIGGRTSAGGPGVLRERLPDGSDVVLADQVYDFQLSPGLARIALIQQGEAALTLSVLTLASGAKELLGYSSSATWWNDSHLYWQTTITNPASLIPQEPGKFVTTFLE